MIIQLFGQPQVIMALESMKSRRIELIDIFGERVGFVVVKVSQGDAGSYVELQQVKPFMVPLCGS